MPAMPPTINQFIGLGKIGKFINKEISKGEGGYQPIKGNLDTSNPPQGGSGLKLKNGDLQRNLINFMKEAVDRKMGLDFMREDNNDIEDWLNKIEENLEEIKRKLDFIFSDHILINGKFCKLEKLDDGFRINGVEIKC